MFHPTQTVLEAVLFQAHMRLSPCDNDATTLDHRAHDVIRKAGLQGKVRG